MSQKFPLTVPAKVARMRPIDEQKALEDAKDERFERKSPDLRTLLTRLTLPNGGPFGPSLRAQLFSYAGNNVVVNSAAVKYLQFLTGSTVSLSWKNIVSNMDEFGSLSAVFNEFFVRWVELEFIPNNVNSSNNTASSTAAGSPGDLNTCAATIAFLVSNQGVPSDASTVVHTLRVNAQSQTVDMGQRWRFRARNPFKFGWDEPLGDQSSATTGMSWCQMNDTSALGGQFVLGTAYSSGASVGLGTLLEGGTFGYLMIRIKLALRVRL